MRRLEIKHTVLLVRGSRSNSRGLLTKYQTVLGETLLIGVSTIIKVRQVAPRAAGPGEEQDGIHIFRRS